MNGSVLPSTEELQLKNRVLRAPAVKFLEDSGRIVEMTPQIKASVIFDMAMKRAGLKNLTAALELQGQKFRVSESLVSRWRNSDEPDLPTNAHIAALGDDFERTYHLCQSKVNGYGRRALLDIAESLGELASAVGE